MTEIYPNIITRVEINDTILPYSSEEGIFNSSLMETLTFDIKPKFGDDVYNDLVTNGSESGATFQEETQELLDEGLKLAIGYYTVARTLRKTVTPTRFGTTQKENIDGTSSPASNSQIVSQSSYYKAMGDELIKQLLIEHKPKRESQNYSFGVRIIGY